MKKVYKILAIIGGILGIISIYNEMILQTIICFAIYIFCLYMSERIDIDEK